MALHHYPYHFVQKVKEGGVLALPFLKYKLLYSFKSPRSHQCYWVSVEVYEHEFYAVKFHLKVHRNCENKYSLMTGLNEARPVINTCIAIMQEIGTSNPRASFGFIGANMDRESTYMTKRFRVYSIMMATYFNEEIFEHFVMMDKSAYVLIRKTELDLYPGLPEELNEKFGQMYFYFD